MGNEFKDVYRSKHILLTTFTRDGRAKPTVVQGTPDDGKLLIFTGRDSWKVKRIRNTSHVTIAACDMRGHSASASVDAIAKLLPTTEVRRVYGLRLRQAGLVRGLYYRLFTALGGGLGNRIVIEVTARAPE
jgi:PPOX class probable F420-dependent enzyme